jgi:hypothetical protein
MLNQGYVQANQPQRYSQMLGTHFDDSKQLKSVLLKNESDHSQILNYQE